MFARLNRGKFAPLNPNSAAPLLISIPFATDRATLIAEKLPGPLFIRIEKSLLIFALCFLVKFNMLDNNISLFCVLL